MQNDERINSIEQDIKSLTAEVANLDKLVTKLVLSLSSHAENEKHMEDTIKNIDKNITDLMLKMAAGPGERQREIQSIVNPIWEHVRKTDKQLGQCEAAMQAELHNSKETIKKDVMQDIKFHSKLIWVAIVVIAGLVSFIYLSDINRMYDTLNSQNKRIDILEHKVP